MSRIRNATTREPTHWNLEYICQQQQACAKISQLKSILQSGIRQIEIMDMQLKAFEDELPNLYVRKDNVLCHYDSKDGNTRIVIPRNLIP